jgi:DNA-binding transcriptional LysR family regulator
MDSRKLHYFEVLAGELHFRKAAEKLFITQPALTRQIRELEDDLGVLLFERNNRNVRLTRAGTFLRNESLLISDQLQRIRRNVQLINRGEEGELQIGFVGSAMQAIIPEALKKLNRDFPKIHSSLQELSNQEQIDAVLAHRLDVGFVRSEHFPVGIANKMVLEENFSLVVPDDHWMTLRKFKNIGQLRQEKFILFGTSYSQDYYALILSIFSDYDYLPEVSHRSVHASTIFHLVESHLGIAIVPSSLTAGFNLRIRFIELKNIRQKTKLYLIWKSGLTFPLLNNFLSLFKAGS